MFETLTSVLTEPGELPMFLQGYVEETGGDPAEIVCQVFVPWRPDATQPRDVRPEYIWTHRALILDFTHAGVVLPLDIAGDLEPAIADGKIEAYGLRKVCPGVWALAPSLLIEGIVHCYLVFHGVPDPAPWESRIIVVSR
jgi:hypothetical protein